MSIHRRAAKGGVRYDVRLRTPDGRQYSRSFRSRRDAETFAREQLSAQQRGAWLHPGGASTLFGEWADEWLRQRVGARPKTIHTDAGIVERHLRPALGSVRLGSVTPRDVRRLVGGWNARFAPNTVRRHYAVLRAIMNAAVDAELIARSPCRAIKLPRVDSANHRILEPSELRRLADALPVEYRPMVYLAGVLGLRFGECAGLRVGRLDFFARTLTVAESVGEVGGRLVAGDPKSKASRRTLSVPEPLMNLLGEHLRCHALTAADSDRYVFTAKNGGPIRYASFRSRVWIPATRDARLEGVTFHSLRHLAATAMVVEGVDIRTAQHRLGHTDPRLLLNVYAHVTTEADRRAAERLGRRFLGPDVVDANDLGVDDGR